MELAAALPPGVSGRKREGLGESRAIQWLDKC